jgi:hypothetical protein
MVKAHPTRPCSPRFRLTSRDATIEEAPQPPGVELAPPPHKADFSDFAMVCRIPAPHPHRANGARPFQHRAHQRGGGSAHKGGAPPSSPGL